MKQNRLTLLLLIPANEYRKEKKLPSTQKLLIENLRILLIYETYTLSLSVFNVRLIFVPFSYLFFSN